MSKYIVEIKPEYEDSFKGLMILGAKESKLFVDALAVEDMEELNSDYINEHYSDLQDTAYQRGFDDAHRISEEEYHRGLEDAWEAAKKLFSSMADSDIEKAFPIEWNNGGFNALMNLQPQEAIEKLKAYEEKQKTDNRIEIGDEVYAYTLSGKTQPFIIIKIYDEDGVKYYSGINADGNHVQGGLNYIKTGRHFPHVVELLKAMKE